MRILKFRQLKTIAWVSGAFVFAMMGLSRSDDNLSPPPGSVERINRAMGVYVTPRGQQYFSRNLEDVLFRNGFAIGDGAFDSFSFKATEPLTLSRLSARMRQHGPLLAAVGDIFKQWLSGFQFSDPLLAGSLRDVSYKLNFSRFGIRPDPAGARARGIRDGVLLVLEIEIPDLRIDIARARMNDRNNAFLAEPGKDPFGVDDFWLKSSATSLPLKISLPFSIDTDRDGKVEMVALPMQTNIASLKLEMGFKRPLILPYIEVRIGRGATARSSALPQQALEDKLLAHQAALFKLVQSYLKDTIESQIPTVINKTLAKLFDDRISEVNQMDPVVLENPTPADKLKWGIQPEEFSMRNGSLELGFSAFIEDPRARRSVALPEAARSNAKARLNAFPAAQYDMAVAINQGLMNRMMQLSFERGYFEKYKTSSGETVKLLASPEMHFNETADGKVFKLHAKFRRKAGGFIERVALEGGLDIDVDLIVKTENHPVKGPRLKILSIDTTTFKVDMTDVRFGFLQGRVQAAVLAGIKESNVWYAAHDESLNDAIPIPPAVFGVPVRIKDLRVETTGNLVLYLEYGVQNAVR